MNEPVKTRRTISWRRKVLYSLIPLCSLMVAAELICRVFRLDEPQVYGDTLMEELSGVVQPDPELFWITRPNLRTYYQRALITTNDQSLRGGLVSAKGTRTARVLCLGESTTFGFGVSDEATYSAQLEQLLRERQPKRDFEVLNAGCCAWTTFQSLTYLKTRGLELHPDVVVFYHWFNDELPTAMRDSNNNEIGIARSDPELYRLRQSSGVSALLRVSAAFRALANLFARWSIDGFSRSAKDSERSRNSSLTRVRPDERRACLEELLELCRTKGIVLVLVHPAYRDVAGRDSVLEDFARDHQIQLVDFPSIIQASGISKESLFRDPVHPNEKGHRMLAEAIADRLSRSFDQDTH
jgi:lysophospholipase L1-like esterase